MRSAIVWGEPEGEYFRRFFDAVDAAVTAELQAGRALLEENLTFLLGRLLDGQSTFQQMLEYSADELNRDLQACGTGTQVAVEFTTNEHTRDFESKVSFADLGIVVRREHSVFGPEYTKGVIVQSKRLYGGKQGYSLSSQYGGFNDKQFAALKALASNHDWDSVAYFLYNPRLEAFNDEDQQIISALETRLCGHDGWMQGEPFWHPEFEYFMHKMLRRRRSSGVPVAAAASDSADAIRDRRRVAVLRRPGLRVLGVSSLADIVKSNGTIRGSFSLQDCYQHALSSRWWGNSGVVPFLPLSSYIVNMLLGCTRGTDNKHIVSIAEGRVPKSVRQRSQERRDPEPDDDAPGVAVRHTLRITVRSTLPERDITFQQ